MYGQSIESTPGGDAFDVEAGARISEFHTIAVALGAHDVSADLAAASSLGGCREVLEVLDDDIGATRRRAYQVGLLGTANEQPLAAQVRRASLFHC